MKKILKTILIILGVFTILLIIITLYFEDYLKNYIEKNDKELVGREIYISSIGINWLGTSFTIEGIDVKEPDEQNSFLKVEELFVDFSIWPLLSSKLVIDSMAINTVELNIEQNAAHFNFDDLLEPKDSAEKQNHDSSTFTFSIRKIALIEGNLRYRNEANQDIRLLNTKIHIPLIDSDLEQIDSQIAFTLSSGGSIEASVDLNLLKEVYEIDSKAEKIDLELVRSYLEEVMIINEFSGFHEHDIKIRGNMNDASDLGISGKINLYDLKLTDTKSDELATLGSLNVSIDTLHVKSELYDVSKLTIDDAKILFELYENGNNFSNAMVPADSLGNDTTSAGVDYSNPFSMLAHYVVRMANTYKASNFHLDTLSITNADATYNDYTMHEIFRYHLSELNIQADALDSENEKLTAFVNANLNGSGKFSAELSLYTHNMADIDLTYSIEGSELADFSPYTNFFVAHNISSGIMKYSNDTQIRNGILTSQNVIDLGNLYFADKSMIDAIYKLPVKLAVSLLKDLKGNIQLDVPIEGDLKDPEYKLRKVIWQTIENILLKAVTAPVRLVAAQFNIDEEQLKELRYSLLQIEPNRQAEKSLNEISRVLDQKSDLCIEFSRRTRKHEEIEAYTILASKTEYLFGFQNEDKLNKEQKNQLEELDIHDSLFTKYINNKIPDEYHYLPIHKKCMIYIGEEKASNAVDGISGKRNEFIRKYLENEKGISADRIRFKLIPEDSLSTNMSTAIYKIDFWTKD